MDFSKDNNHNTNKKADEQQQSEDGNEVKKEEKEQEEANSHDEDNPKITDSEKTVVITLKGTHLGATDTEGIIEHETTPIVELRESRHVSFKDSDSSSTISSAPLTQSKGLIKIRTSASAPAIVIQHEHAVVAENLETVLPHSEPDYMTHTERSTQSNDKRIQHILSLFDHLTKNLETIEKDLATENKSHSTKEPSKKSSSSKDDLVQVHKSRYEIHHEKGHHERRSSRSSRSSHRQSSCSSELRITQLFQLPQLPRNQQNPQPLPPLAPQSSYNAIHERGETNPNYTYMQAPSYIVDLTTNLVPTQAVNTSTAASNVVIKQPEMIKYSASMHAKRPPCERTFHTITISANSPVQPPRNNQNPNWMTRCGDALSDFVTAICLCLQVNKDCVFCLGFFVAFVVSASFLTAFFYRTLNMTPQTIHIQQEGIYNENPNPTTVRLSGFYYIYNRHHRMPN